MRPRVRDWAQWDDTYAFVKTRDPAYVESNLTPAILADLEMDLMVILNTEGEVVWGRASDELATRAGKSG